jgi:hypothetical protein
MAVDSDRYGDQEYKSGPGLASKCGFCLLAVLNTDPSRQPRTRFTMRSARVRSCINTLLAISERPAEERDTSPYRRSRIHADARDAVLGFRDQEG